MSEDSGQEKTEEPTDRKVSKAREEGKVAKSQEVSSWFMLLALAMMIGIFGQWIFRDLGDIMVRFIAQPESFALDESGIHGTASDIIDDIVAVLFLPFLFIICAALISSVVQNGVVFSTEQLKVDFSKIGFKKGLSKMFSMNSLAEFGKGIVKISIVSIIVCMVVWPERDQLVAMITMEIPEFLLALQATALKVVVTVLAVLTLITVADIVFQRYQHTKSLRMTKQEIKDEQKQTDGDPKVKRRLAQIRFDRARQRMMTAVPSADVIITNPTHYAIALRYDQAAMEAPRLLAKGVDNMAQRIREVGRENKVPIVENPPLARALYASVEIDQEVPPEHYQAVAQVIGYVMRLHGKLRSTQRREEGQRRNKRRLGRKR